MARQYQFTAIPGIFEDHAQLAKSASDRMVRTQPNLGLLGQKYESDSPDNGDSSQWERFVGYLTHLNETSSDDTWYKLIYLVRHGTGVHNEVMKAVGDDWRVCLLLNLSFLPSRIVLPLINAELTSYSERDRNGLSRKVVMFQVWAWRRGWMRSSSKRE